MNSIKRTRREIEKVLKDIPIDGGGGCSVSKATVMAYLIKSQKIKNSVDIGIYRGRSFFPQAYVHTHYTKGTVYGIDPYSKEEAMEFDHKELEKEIKHFVKTTDFNDLFSDVMSFRKKLGLEKGSRVVRKTANIAAKDFQKNGKTFGLIHVDGNHDTAAVLADVNNYMPLVAKGGFLVLDDISWRSVRPAVDLVSASMTLIYARVDSLNDYAVFWNGSSRTKKAILRNSVALAGEN